MELATCARLSWAGYNRILLVSFELDTHRDLMKHLRCRFFHRLRLTVLDKAIMTIRQLEKEEHGRDNAVLEGILGVFAIGAHLSSIRLLERAKHLAVFVSSEDELWVLGKSAIGFRGFLDR